MVRAQAGDGLTAGQALGLMIDAAGMTQVELAQRTNLSAKHVNQIIKGHAHLTPEVAVAVADALVLWLMQLDTADRMAAVRRARGI